MDIKFKILIFIILYLITGILYVRIYKPEGGILIFDILCWPSTKIWRD